MTPKDYQEQKNQIAMTRQQEVSNELQNNWFLRILQISEQSLPQIASGIANIYAAGYTEEAAYAEAAKMLFQQALQADQSMSQTAEQAITANSQDLQSFLDTFGRISSGLTQQA